MDARKKLEVDDRWPPNRLDAKSVVEKLEQLVRFRPAGVMFYVDEGLPWVEVQYDDIVHPGSVVPVGQAIEKGTNKPMLFQALRPNSICYVLNVEPGWLTNKETDPRLPATDYGVPLDELRDSWQLSQA